MQLSDQLPASQTPSSYMRPAASLRGLRRLALAGLAVLTFGAWGIVVCHCAQESAALLRDRCAVQQITELVRVMRAQAMATRRTIQVHIDAERGAFRLSSLQASSNPYEIFEHTVWLPAGLEVSEAPAILTALPSGEVTAGSIILTAPSHNTRFHLTLYERGAVQVNEESIL